MNSVPSVVSDRKSLDCISSRGGIFHSLRTFERQQYVSISVLSVTSVAVAVSHTLTVRPSTPRRRLHSWCRLFSLELYILLSMIFSLTCSWELLSWFGLGPIAGIGPHCSERRGTLQSLTSELQKLQCRYDDEERRHKQTTTSLHHVCHLVNRSLLWAESRLCISPSSSTNACHAICLSLSVCLFACFYYQCYWQTWCDVRQQSK